jgi:signal peptidase I
MSKRKSALRYYRSYRPESKLKKALRLLIGFLALLFIVKVLVSSLLLSSYTIHTESLLPALEPGEKLLASPFPYGGEVPFTSWRLPAPFVPERGDLVVYRTPSTMPLPWWKKLLSEPYRFFTGEQLRRLPFTAEPIDAAVAIGRVVALPGDTLRLENGRAKIKPPDSTNFTDEFALTGRKYEILPQSLPEGWENTIIPAGNSEVTVLAPGTYFIMNDNRSHFSDSRLWGPGNLEDITAKVLLSYWPHFSLH